MKKQKQPRKLSRNKSGQYKVKNWSQYNRSLKNRGSITLWLSEEIKEQWYYRGEKQRGAQFKYSDQCIEACCIIRKVYHLPLRQTEGLLTSIMEILKSDLEIPDYSVLCRRNQSLSINSLFEKRILRGENLHIVMDSTGLKVYGEGEWKVRQHGYSKRRTWRKIHIAMDPETSLIHAAEMTSNGMDDADMVKPLLEKINGKVKKLGGDGAYDKTKVYDLLEKKQIKPLIPPRKNARIKQHGNCRSPDKPRDRAIRYIRVHGRKKWKRIHHYHKRSMAENTMFRYKTIIGDKLQSRKFENQYNEVLLSCKILNKMTKCGMPQSVKVK